MRKASAELAKMKKVLLSLSQDDREKALSALSLRERQVLAMRLGLSGSPDVLAAAIALATTAVIWRAESNRAKMSEEDRLMQERIDREHEEIREMRQCDVY